MTAEPYPVNDGVNTFNPTAAALDSRETDERTAWSPRQRLRIYASVLALLLWGASAINYATPGTVSRNGNIKGGDYAHFYSFGRLVALGRAAEIYDPVARQQEVAHSVSSTREAPYLAVYGPQVALALAPLGWLPYSISLTVWWIGATTVYIAVCCLFWSARMRSWLPWRESLILALAYPGFWELFIYGQTTWIALACFAVVWMSLRTNRWLPAGLAVGLLVFKPQLGVALAVVLIAQRRWKTILTAGAVVVLQGLICWVTLGGTVLREYLAVLIQIPHVTSLLEPDLSQTASLRGFFLLLDLPAPWSALLYATAAGIVCVRLLAVWKTATYDIAFAALLIATVLVAPHATVYDLVLIAPALLLIVPEALAAGLRKHLLLAGAAYFVPISGYVAAESHVQLVAPVLVLLFVATTALRTRRAPQARSCPAPC